jgi:hypothetical protein
MSQQQSTTFMITAASSTFTVTEQLLKHTAVSFVDTIRAVCRHVNVPDPYYIAPLHHYNVAYWKQCMMYGNNQFKRHFRMTKDHFILLHSKVYDSYNGYGNCYHSEFKLGVFLYRMATRQSCRILFLNV